MRAALLAAVAALVISASSATAQEAPEDKIVCKRVLDTQTGSNFRGKKKVCRTESEWKQMQDDTDRTIQKVRSGGSVDPNQPQTFGGSPS